MNIESSMRWVGTVVIVEPVETVVTLVWVLTVVWVMKVVSVSTLVLVVTVGQVATVVSVQETNICLFETLQQIYSLENLISRKPFAPS